MANDNNRLVTFSKRRSGLFKKASELSTLCGVDIAMIVFSPAKKVFSFGHPSVESVVNRYLGRTNPAQNSDRTLQLVEAHRNAGIRQLNAQLTEKVIQLEAEKKRGEELDKMRKFGEENNWWEAPVDNLGFDELKKLKMAMEELKNNVANQKMMMEAASAENVTSFFSASSSSYGGLLGNVGSGANDGIGLGPSMMPHGYALGYGSGVGHVGPSSVMGSTELGLPMVPPNGYAQGYGYGRGFF